MKIIWALHYDSKVTAFLYSLRGTETATVIHEAIRELQYEVDPTEGRQPIPERPGRYVFTVAGHRIGIQVKGGDRKDIVILYIKRN